MKKAFLGFIILIFLFGCDVFNNNSSDGKKDFIEDLNVSEDFNFETTEEVEVQVHLFDRGNIPVPGIFFSIYDADPDSNGKLMAKGVTNVNGSYSTTINLSNPESINFSLTVFMSFFKLNLALFGMSSIFISSVYSNHFLCILFILS